MRPVLIHSAYRVWRDRQTLQLGTLPGAAQVLTGVDESARRVLTLLDGTRDVADIMRAASQEGCPPERASDLLDLLLTAGLVRDADARWPASLTPPDRERLVGDVLSLALAYGDPMTVLRRRDAARVVVLGGGRVGASVASLLAASGVGTVDVLDEQLTRLRDTHPMGLRPDDVGVSRGAAGRDRVREHAPSVRTGPVQQPDLVVLAPPGATDDLVLLDLVQAAVPHLYAGIRETLGVVGPLVLPGVTACLSCLDQTRTDHDPDWPAIAAQLSHPSPRPRACDTGLAAAVAAQAALQALEALDGGSPATLDGSLELALPGWEWRRRSWSRHPACDCHWKVAG